jgi:hypothetical protein
MRNIQVLIIALLSCFVVNAQTPVQVTPQLLPPYSLQASEYYSGIQPKLQVLLLNRDINQPTIQVKLRLTIESQNCRMQTKVNANTPTFTLTSGIPYYMTPQDLQPFFTASNIDFGGGYSEQEYVQTGRLPEGLYSFYIEAFELLSGNLVSNKGFTLGWLTLADPPILNTPAKAEGVSPTNPQNVIFNWTPRHNTSPTAGYLTDYIFTLVEYNDINIGPEASFTSSPPFFIDSTQTTTYLFGPGQPQLIAGKRYAWRVQAKAKNGAQEIAMFRNNGFSEVFWFTYQNNCLAPLGINHTVQGQRATIEWSNNPQHMEWKVEYREKNNPDAQWFTIGNTLPRVMLTDLKPGTQYEYRVGGSCIIGQFTYSGLYSFTTGGSPVPPVPNCGDSTLPAQGSGQLLQTLNAGDTIRAGSFTVHVGFSAGAGSFTGMGYVIVPWLMNAKVEVRFTNITLSLDHKLLSGIIETTYDPNESGIADIDEYIDVFTPGYGVGGVITGQVSADTTVGYPILWPGGIVATLPSGYNQQTGMPAPGTTIPITITNALTNAQTTIQVDQLPTTIMDANGNVYQVATNGSVSLVAQPGGTELLQNMNKKVIDGDKALVIFSQTENAKYAFDKWQPIYKKSSTFSKEYEKIACANGGLSIHEGYYYVSAKAMAPGATDTLIVVIRKPAGSTISNDSIQFVNGKGTKYIKTPINDSTFAIPIVGGPEKDAQEIYAVYKQANAKTLNLGKLLVASYAVMNPKLVLIAVNGINYNSQTIKDSLDKIYKPVGISWQLETKVFNSTVWDEGNNGILKATGTGIGVYTEEMKALNREFILSEVLDDNAVYVFVLNKSDSNGLRGVFPRGRKFGYLFLENGTTDIGKVTAHELAHGKFNLKHIFEHGDLEAGQMGFNLMDYPHGYTFSKMQWDNMRDPALVISMFEGETGVWSADTDKGKKNEGPTTTLHYMLTPGGKFIKKGNDISGFSAFVFNRYDQGPQFTVIGIEINDKIHRALYTEGTNKFLRYQGLEESVYLLNPQPSSGSIRVVQDYDNKCYGKYQDIDNWSPDAVAGRSAREVSDIIQSKVHEGEWTASLWKGKNGTEPECADRYFVDTSVLNAGYSRVAIEKIKEILKAGKENPFTGSTVQLKVFIILSYSDQNKNNKTIEIETTNGVSVLKINNQIVKPSADQVYMWVQIQDDNKAKLMFMEMGDYVKQKATETLGNFGQSIDWIQLSRFQQIMQAAGEVWDSALDGIVDILDWVANGIKKLKIPQYVYDNSHPKYKAIYSDIFSFVVPAGISDNIFRQSEMYETLREVILQRSGIDINSYPEFNKMIFALCCGLYNGCLDVIASVPELLGSLISLAKTDGIDNVINKLSQFAELEIKDESGNIVCQKEQYWCKIKKIVKAGLSEMFSLDPNKICLTAHNIGAIIGPILVTCLTGDAAALEGSLSGVTRTAINLLKWCDNFGFQQMKLASSFVLKNSGKLWANVTKMVNNVVEPLIEQIDDLKFRVKVIFENTTQWQWLENVTQEELAVLMKTSDGNMVALATRLNLPKVKINFQGIGDVVNYLVNKTKLTSAEIERLVAKGVGHSDIDKLAIKFGDRSTQYRRLERIIDENLKNDAERVKAFLKDLKDGIDNDDKSGLLNFFDEAESFWFDAWDILSRAGRTDLKLKRAALDKITEVCRNSNFTSSLNINGTGWKQKLIDICDAQGKGGHQYAKSLVEHLDDLNLFFNKYNGVTGIDNLVKDLSNGSSIMQSGAQYAVLALNKLDLAKDKIKKFDFIFEGDNLPCTNCKFDVEMKLPVPKPSDWVKFYEFKSLANAAEISFDQFKNYLSQVVNLSELKYVFDMRKLGTKQAVVDGLSTLLKTKKSEIFNVMQADLKQSLGINAISDLTDSKIVELVDAIVDLK